MIELINLGADGIKGFPSSSIRKNNLPAKQINDEGAEWAPRKVHTRPLAPNIPRVAAGASAPAMKIFNPMSILIRVIRLVNETDPRNV